MPRKQKYVLIVNDRSVWEDSRWSVSQGELKPIPGGAQEERLFKVIGEKLPFDCIDKVSAHLRKITKNSNGVYLVFDSTGRALYAGIGHIFRRLRAHRTAHSRKLRYFSFYVLQNRNHMREVETILVRTAGPLLRLNAAKKDVHTTRTSVRHYETGTIFYQRLESKGKRVTHGGKAVGRRLPLSHRVRDG